MKPDNGISVIICTYNGASRIEMTLKHLAEQVFVKPIKWEIIIVDNGSEDAVKDTAKLFWKDHGILDIEFRIINEQKTGLSFARETGINASKYRYIIFCDDDNWLDKSYVTKAYDTISSNNDIGALGGQSTAASSVSLPHWFEKSKANYAVGAQAFESGDLTSRRFLWGSGIIIRKELYNIAYKKFPSLLIGRSGKNLSSGEDSEMCIRFIMMGFKLFYSDELKFEHFISENRLTEAYNQKLIQGFNEAFDILKLYNLFIEVKTKTKWKRNYEFLISVLKLIFFRKLMESEKLNFYLVTNLNLNDLDKNLIKINKIYKEIHNYKARINNN